MPPKAPPKSKSKQTSKAAPQQNLFASPRWLEEELRTQGYQSIVGIDEAGRGPLAGPVVAAAALLPPDVVLPELDDSKRLTETQRDALFDTIHEVAIALGTGIVCAAEIDNINILAATKKAMALAADSLIRLLPTPPDLLLIDGNQRFPYDVHMMTVVKGDQRCQNVAAASVVAKVTRDRLMAAYDQLYPQYQFAGHKGYPTPLHKQLIIEHGPCPIHRRTFRGALPEAPKDPTP